MRVRGLLREQVLPRACACLLCGDKRRARTQDGLCPTCRAMLEEEYISVKTCGRCGLPLEKGRACAFCQSALSGGVSMYYAPFYYVKSAKRLVRLLKYSYLDEAAQPLCRAMLRVTPYGRFDALVPVPLHASRLRLRGANQARVLAEAFGALCGRPVLDALERVRGASSQTKAGKSARAGNVTDAFTLCGSVRGMRILLIDDVRTTGATTHECASALLSGGAAEVAVLTACITPRHNAARRARAGLHA